MSNISHWIETTVIAFLLNVYNISTAELYFLLTSNLHPIHCYVSTLQHLNFICICIVWKLCNHAHSKQKTIFLLKHNDTVHTRFRFINPILVCANLLLLNYEKDVIHILLVGRILINSLFLSYIVLMLHVRQSHTSLMVSFVKKF